MSETASPPPGASAASFGECTNSILRGVGIGVGVGAAFHIVSGGVLRSAGRTTLSKDIIIRQAASASLRLGAVLGATAVAVPTAIMPERQAFLRSYYANVLKQPKSSVSLGVILASSAVSGAATFGVADWLLGKAGWQW